jgi:hypothetical protein
MKKENYTKRQFFQFHTNSSPKENRFKPNNNNIENGSDSIENGKYTVMPKRGAVNQSQLLAPPPFPT